MEANTLRAILLVAGIIILLAIYFADKIKKRPKPVFDEGPQASDEPNLSSAATEKIQPIIASEPYLGEPSSRTQPYIAESAGSVEESLEAKIRDEDVSVAEVAADEPDESINEQLEPKPVEPLTPENSRQKYEGVPVVEQAPLIQLAVISNADAAMEGAELLNTFTELKLEFGDMGIFHYYQRKGDHEQQLFHVANMVEPGAFPVGSMSDFETKGVLFFMQAGTSVDSLTAFDEMLEAARQLSQRFQADLMDDQKQLLTIEKITFIQQQLADLSRL